MTERTVDSVIAWFEETVKSRTPISPNRWVEAAADLNVLQSGEQEKYFELLQEIAQMRVKHLENGFTVAKAKVYIETTDEYRHALILKAKIDRIVEFIRIAKIQSRMAIEEMKRIEADTGGDRRARRQRQDHARQDQRHDRRKQQLVDGPPPLAQRRALFA